MSFNSGITKQVQEFIFSRKKKNTSYPSLYFNNTPIQRQSVKKHLGLFSDEIVFGRYYKCFIRPHLDYGDVIYDQPNISSLANKIKSVQYQVALAIIGAIRGTSQEKLYQALGFESLKDRRRLRRLCYLYKIVNAKQLTYLYDLIPPFQGMLYL